MTVHVTAVRKTFERAINNKTLSHGDVLISLNEAMKRLYANDKRSDEETPIIVFDKATRKKAWKDVRKTACVRKSRSSGSNIRLMRDVWVGLVIEQEFSIGQVADCAVSLIAETGGKTQRERYAKANLKIVAYVEALTKPAQ